MKLTPKEREDLHEKVLDGLAAAKNDMEMLSRNRVAALDAYNQRPYGNEVEGRSEVVMSDVQDTVEWIMPNLMRIFYGGPEVVTCRPNGPDDVEKAPLMEQKLNFDFQRKLGGFTILHDWFKDALLLRAGVVKYYWKKEQKYIFRQFDGIDDIELQALKANPEYEIEDVKPIKQEVPGYESSDEPLVAISYNVSGYEVQKDSYPVVESLAPEEAIYTIGASTTKDAGFFAHKKRLHKNKVKHKYNLKDEDIAGAFESFKTDADVLARYRDLGGMDFLTDDDRENFVFVYECYVDHYDKMGRKIPHVVTVMGDEIIKTQRNPYGKPTFCILSPIRVPHRIIGRSIYDLVGELQKLRTALVRAMLDNVYYQNNGVNVFNPYRLNEEDLDTQNIPGGNIRTLYDVDPHSTITPMPVKPLAPWSFQILEMTEDWSEKRTGVSRRQQGLSPDNLSNTKSGAVSQIMSASMQRIEMIARLFAETGVKELFEAMRDMNLMFFDRQIALKLNDDWATVSPDQINGSFDILIDVGVGTGTKEYQAQQLIQLMNLTVPAMQMGVVTPENVYNMLKEIYRTMGRKDVDRFITEPSKNGFIPQDVVQTMLQLLQRMGVNVQGLLAQAQAAAQAQQKTKPSGGSSQGPSGQASTG